MLWIVRAFIMLLGIAVGYLTRDLVVNLRDPLKKLRKGLDLSDPLDERIYELRKVVYFGRNNGSYYDMHGLAQAKIELDLLEEHRAIQKEVDSWVGR